jgi:hypothetical protein
MKVIDLFDWAHKAAKDNSDYGFQRYNLKVKIEEEEEGALPLIQVTENLYRFGEIIGETQFAVVSTINPEDVYYVKLKDIESMDELEII